MHTSNSHLVSLPPGKTFTTVDFPILIRCCARAVALLKKWKESSESPAHSMWHSTLRPGLDHHSDRSITCRLLPGGKLAYTCDGLVARIYSVGRGSAKICHRFVCEEDMGKIVEMDYQVNEDGTLTLVKLCEP
jgi:hypothetical protein